MVRDNEKPAECELFALEKTSYIASRCDRFVPFCKSREAGYLKNMQLFHFELAHFFPPYRAQT